MPKPFNQSFNSIEQLERSTPEQIGIAIVLHMQVQAGRRFSPHNFQSEINHFFGNQGSPPWLMQRISEGMMWAQQMLLAVPDLSQPHAVWYVLSRTGVEFEPAADLERLQIERLLPEFLLHPDVRDASAEIFKIGRYDAAVFEAFKLVETKVRDAAGFTAEAHGIACMTMIPKPTVSVGSLKALNFQSLARSEGVERASTQSASISSVVLSPVSVSVASISTDRPYRRTLSTSYSL